MSPTLILYFLTFSMVAANTWLIYTLQKKRKSLDVSVHEHAVQAKKLKTSVIMLYFYTPVSLAVVWLFIAPALLQHAQHVAN